MTLNVLVMEFVDGADLAEVVKNRGPLPVAEACDYIAQAAQGLEYAHERGMVHRDIKPHNLIVTSELRRQDSGLRAGLTGSSADPRRTVQRQTPPAISPSPVPSWGHRISSLPSRLGMLTKLTAAATSTAWE